MCTKPAFPNIVIHVGAAWSWNPENNLFVVSPEPDVLTRTINIKSMPCLILATNGLWNVVTASEAVNFGDLRQEQGQVCQHSR